MFKLFRRPFWIIPVIPNEVWIAEFSTGGITSSLSRTFFSVRQTAENDNPHLSIAVTGPYAAGTFVFWIASGKNEMRDDIGAPAWEGSTGGG